jgi:hypothetical protein
MIYYIVRRIIFIIIRRILIMKKIVTKLFCIVLVLAGTISAFALEINGKAPTFTANDPDLEKKLNDEAEAAFKGVTGSIHDQIKEQVGDIETKPEKFIQAWGNSGVFASHGATQRAFSDYKLFAVTAGPMIGLQIPSDPFSIMEELGDLRKRLNEENDLKIGANFQIINLRVGINTSKFLLQGLYLGLHIGFMKMDDMIEGFSFNNFSIGGTVNYQLVPSKSLAKGLVLWRGVNLGSGIIYQGTKIGYELALDPVDKNIDMTSMPSIPGLDNVKLAVDPKLILDMDINTVTIPLEATTAVRLLWFLNIPLGLGMDLGFGKSDLTIGMKGDVNAVGIDDNNAAGIKQKDSGYVTVNAGGDVIPFPFNIKLITGIGLSLGPVVLDVPVTYYFIDNGFNVGVTLGVVW